MKVITKKKQAGSFLANYTIAVFGIALSYWSFQSYQNSQSQLFKIEQSAQDQLRVETALKVAQEEEARLLAQEGLYQDEIQVMALRNDALLTDLEQSQIDRLKVVAKLAAQSEGDEQVLLEKERFEKALKEKGDQIQMMAETLAKFQEQETRFKGKIQTAHLLLAESELSAQSSDKAYQDAVAAFDKLERKLGELESQSMLDNQEITRLQNSIAGLEKALIEEKKSEEKEPMLLSSLDVSVASHLKRDLDPSSLVVERERLIKMNQTLVDQINTLRNERADLKEHNADLERNLLSAFSRLRRLGDSNQLNVVEGDLVADRK